MEPSGRNRWQPVAIARPGKSRKEGKTVAVGCDQLPKSFHGKEGVDGSSPSEGSARRLWNSQISDAARPRLARAEVRR
jgi:hypothetical protein